MKTNPFARGIRRIRLIVLCLAIAALAAVEFRLSGSLARFSQTAALQSQGPQFPNVSLDDMLGAAR
jgi:hypothetical protein